MNRRGRHAKWPLLVAILFLLALIPFALYRGSQVPEAEAAWWSESWRYRQSIAVTNNTTQQTNVYISVSLDTSNTSKFQADCGDLRFTKQNGQLLPYYIASGCGTASTSVHVQLDTFPAGAQTFYAYYGSPSADNGFSSNDFLTQATNYTVGGTGSEEVGPGPVAYWKFDEGSGSTAFDSASYGLGDEVLVDGNMEAADTSEWIASTYATLSKETSNPHEGSRLIRVANNSGSTAQVIAHQEVLSPGKTYRVSGYARSDGVAIPKVVNYSQLIWQGSKSTEWQYFEVVFTAITTWGAEQLRLEGYFGNGVFAEYDDVSVMEIIAGNTGTITGATWANEDQCVSGKCLTFDGVDDKTSLVSPLDLGTTHTVEAWFKPTATINSFKAILGGADSTNYAIFLNGESIYYKAQGSTVSTSMPVQTNTWYHYALVRSGTSIKYFLNGKQIDTDTLGSNNSLTVTTIGAITNSYNFPGLIDEVKIFPYALSEDQIEAEYNLGAAAVMGTGPTVAPPASGTLKDSLVAHWAFDEQYGQTAHDKVGNNHGTFGGSTNPGSDDPTWKPANECKLNGCLSFDGGDHLSLGTFVDNSNSHTFAMWVRSSAAISGTKFLFDIATTRTVIAWHQIPGKISFYTSGWHDSTLDPPNDGQWHHLAYVLNGTTSKGAIYIDGELGQENITYSPTTFNGVAAIGAHNAAANYWFTGYLDEFKIYTTALTADQVKQDMNAGASVAYSVGSEEADELADGAGAPPIAEWKFDEKQGTVTYDSSGNANDGTVNGATWKSGCQQGACLVFDGVDDYVTMGDIEQFTFQEDFTVEFWMYPRTGGSNFFWGGVSKAGTNGSREWELGFDPSQSDAIRFLIGNSTGSWDTDVIRGNGLSRNIWHHVVGRVSNGQIDIFIDGQQTGTSATYTNSLKNTTSPVYIGNVSSYETSSSFNGQIDHVRIYDYARTPAQIAYDYNRGAPVAHWKFDECEGTVAHDASGNENHGTINIGATGTQTTAGTCSTSGAWANGASGKFEGSLRFDGTDDYVSVADSNSISVTNGPFSYFAWVYVKGSLASNTSVLRKRPANFVMGYNSRLIHCNLNGTSVNTGTQLLSNSWHFLGCTYDGTTLKGYLDGVFQGSVAATPVVDSNQVLELGGQSTGSQMVNGQIDDVRIFNYALSPEQVQKVYNQGYGVRYAPSN